MFERENSDIEFEFKVLSDDALLEGLQDATLDLVAGSLATFDRKDFRIDPLYSEKYFVLFHSGHRFSDKDRTCVCLIYQTKCYWIVRIAKCVTSSWRR